MKAKNKSIPDEHLMKTIKSGVDASEAFTATRDWSFERVKMSVESRGDTFDRDGAVVFEEAGAEVLRVLFSALPVTIGSAEAADFRLERSGVSRMHCHLEPVGSLVRIHDNGSTNGVLLNGKKIDSDDLCDGDELQLGSAVLRVRNL